MGDGAWIGGLRNRVATIGKELVGNGANYTFPVDLIVRSLEGLRRTYDNVQEQGSASQLWPAQSVLDAGVPFYEVLTSYDSILSVEIVAVGDVAARWVHLFVQCPCHRRLIHPC